MRRAASVDEITFGSDSSRIPGDSCRLMSETSTEKKLVNAARHGRFSPLSRMHVDGPLAAIVSLRDVCHSLIRFRQSGCKRHRKEKIAFERSILPSMQCCRNGVE